MKRSPIYWQKAKRILSKKDPIFKKTLNGKPKAMLEICGKTLLEHQVQGLNNNNLADITVIAGYGRDQMRAEGINILENPDFKNGSMLNSFCRIIRRNTIGIKVFLQKFNFPSIFFLWSKHLK